MKIVLKILIPLLIVCALPFIVEAVISTYEIARDPWIRPGAVVMPGGALKTGMNRRAYNEIRFSSTGLRFRIEVRGISSEMVDTLESKIRGTVTMLRGKDGEELAESSFTLHRTVTKDVSVVESRASTDADLAAGMDLARKYDVEYELVPVTPSDRAAADKIKNYEFAREEEIEFDFLIEGAAMPKQNAIVFIYAKTPTSILRGTFLENMNNRLRGIRTYENTGIMQDDALQPAADEADDEAAE